MSTDGPPGGDGSFSLLEPWVNPFGFPNLTIKELGFTATYEGKVAFAGAVKFGEIETAVVVSVNPAIPADIVFEFKTKQLNLVNILEAFGFPIDPNTKTMLLAIQIFKARCYVAPPPGATILGHSYIGGMKAEIEFEFLGIKGTGIFELSVKQFYLYGTLDKIDINNGAFKLANFEDSAGPLIEAKLSLFEPPFFNSSCLCKMLFLEGRSKMSMDPMHGFSLKSVAECDDLKGDSAIKYNFDLKFGGLANLLTQGTAVRIHIVMD